VSGIDARLPTPGLALGAGVSTALLDLGFDVGVCKELSAGLGTGVGVCKELSVGLGTGAGSCKELNVGLSTGAGSCK